MDLRIFIFGYDGFMRTVFEPKNGPQDRKNGPQICILFFSRTVFELRTVFGNLWTIFKIKTVRMRHRVCGELCIGT
jgi:hypothetical protein